MPELEGCTVEAVTESPLRTSAADALAKECEADPASANKKYEKLSFKVTGTIVS